MTSIKNSPVDKQQCSFFQVGRARHFVRAGPGAPVSERRARSDAPCPATHPHNENCCVDKETLPAALGWL
jgi:hypothetical protein